MSDSTENFVSPDTDDLNAFDDLMHGRAKEAPIESEPASKEEVVEEVEDDAQNTEETVDSENDGDDAPENETDDDEPEAEAKPKPKGNRFQERIDELTRDRYEEKRRADALEDKLNQLLEKLDNPTPANTAKAPEATTGPSPDEKNEDGSEKYPLGEFDPNYIRDLTRHTMAEEKANFQREQEEASKRATEEAKFNELQTQWSDKLNKAIEDKYPDFIDKNRELEATLSTVDDSYGQYLAQTIMSMDYGTDVLYHLASNPAEAKRIVDMGATKATIALGRLEALYAEKADAEAKPKLRVSSAPKPPVTNKGTSVATTVRPDTDDLEAFERLMFSKKG